MRVLFLTLFTLAVLSPASAQVVRLTDIAPGSSGSVAAGFTAYDGAVYFRAGGPSGTELYRITEAGDVELAADIATGGPNDNSSFPNRLTVYDGALYFSAGTTATGFELYRYTVAGGAELAADIWPGDGDSLMGGENNAPFTVYDGALFFRANDGTTGLEMYRYTVATGAVRLADLNAVSSNISNNTASYTFAELGGALYFTANDGVNGLELWRYTTAGGLALASDPDDAFSGFTWLTTYQGAIYASALSFENPPVSPNPGRELVRWTAGGDTELVADINTAPRGVGLGSQSSDIAEITVFDGALYFSADDGVNGRELWRYTAASGAELAADTRPGATASGAPFSSRPVDLSVLNDGLYYFARYGSAQDSPGLIRYARQTGARVVGDPTPRLNGSAFVGALAEVGGALYFRGDQPGFGTEVFRYTVPTLTFEGAAGWRIITVAAEGQTVGGVLAPVWTQGFPGADTEAGTASVSFYDEAVDGSLNDGFRAPVSAEEALAPGVGAFVYVFADDDPATAVVDGGFPKALPVYGLEPALPFTFALTYSDNADGGTDLGDDAQDDGWTLLGNPVWRALDWPAVWSASTTQNVDPTAYVYDASARTYRSYDAALDVGDLAGAAIPAGAGMWVRATGPDPELIAPLAAAPARRESVPHVRLALAAVEGGQALESQAVIAFADGRSSASLVPPDTAHLRLAVFDGDRQLAISAHGAIDGIEEIPLSVQAPGVAGEAVFTWPVMLDDASQSVLLVDALTGTETKMSSTDRYAFTLDGDLETRFSLRVQPFNTNAEGEAEPFAVSAVWPNPSSGPAGLSVTGAVHVRVEVFDALGRSVATVWDGPPAGRVALPIDLAPGAYAVRVVADETVTTRTFVVVR